jgi:hypothetical protein
VCGSSTFQKGRSFFRISLTSISITDKKKKNIKLCLICVNDGHQGREGIRAVTIQKL